MGFVDDIISGARQLCYFRRKPVVEFRSNVIEADIEREPLIVFGIHLVLTVFNACDRWPEPMRGPNSLNGVEGGHHDILKRSENSRFDGKSHSAFCSRQNK